MPEMNVAQRSNVLSLVKWSLDKLTEHYPKQTLTEREKERVERLAQIFKRWMTREPQTPQLAFHRACDLLGIEPAEAIKILRGL